MEGEGAAAVNKSDSAENLQAFEFDSDDDADSFDHIGIDAIDRACCIIYPDQPNPLQASAMIKFWLGGPDPLDYISMYGNEGDMNKNIPPHWHYISYGFSDLHGDGRVHRQSKRGEASGFGFELTFRLKRNPEEETPPMWPSTLMNRLARYVFQTGNVLHIGDHIPWESLNGDPESRIAHILIAEDPQLLDLDTQHGELDFRQIVGVTDDEVKTAQKWKGSGVLSLLPNLPQVGPFYITDVNRKESIFDHDPSLIKMVAEGIEKEGSNLGHVTAMCSWSECIDNSMINTSSFLEKLDISRDEAENTPPVFPEYNEVVYKDTPVPVNLDSVHLYFDARAAELLPMVVRTRLKKDLFFIFHNAENLAIHLIPTNRKDTEGIFVTEKDPIKMQGTYLQIFCTTSFINEMEKEFEILQPEDTNKKKEIKYPLEFKFNNPHVQITVNKEGAGAITQE